MNTANTAKRDTPASPTQPGILPKPANACALVVGGGTMGADVALVLARAGCRTIVLEPTVNRRQALDAYFNNGLSTLQVPHRRDRLSACASMDDVDWSAIDLVIECIPEQLGLKQALFADLERRARPNALLCSNSSSFPISAIAQDLDTPQRMLGLHFFMPAHLVPLVEVVLGQHTNPALADSLHGFMRACGMVPVLVRKDMPGFLANRLQHAMAREAFALIDAGVASAEDVDAAVRFGFGFRFLAAGPVLQRDHAGLDVHCAAAATMYPTLAANTIPAKALSERVANDCLGMKTGEGFFRWTPESIAAERRRYDTLLQAGLRLLAPELPPIETILPAARTDAATSVSPLILAVAPNGAYKTRADHPALPMTAQSLAATARTCLNAGAAMLHLHVRDDQGRHSLNVDLYRDAIAAVKAVTGDELLIQVTSEAAGIYAPREQVAMVQALRPEALSLALREVCATPHTEEDVSSFFTWLARERVLTQVILYDTADVERWLALRASGVIPAGAWSVLFVLGRYSAGQVSSPADLLPFLAAFDGSVPWAMCAFGAKEYACAFAAMAFGGHVRVGFENNLWLRDGSLAPDNAALAAQVAEGTRMFDRPLATATQARAIFGG